MRSIAKRANISLANIYNYFKSKNDIFCEVLKPLTNKIEDYLEYMKPENYPDLYNCDLEEHLEISEKMAYHIDREREMLKVLIFKSSGSSLEGFKDIMIDKYTKMCLEYSKVISVHETGSEFVVSEFVAHNIAGTWANFIVESLMHDLSKDEITKAGREMMIFMYNGWAALIKKKV
jgi:AcrR family transcriptional regulator